ncbi:MAG: RHS repeat protein, partial [Acidobacteria bacterium]|nr:RHS repeat protein [Acidobacteriota bacterium]
MLIALLMLVSSRAIIYADPPSSTTQGGRPAGSYDLGGFDNVNLFNGNLNFRLPLLKVGGRGDVSFTMPLIVETRWQQILHYNGSCPVWGNSPVGGMYISPSFGELEDATTTSDYVEAADPGTTCNPTGYLPTKAVVAFNLALADGTRYKFHPVVNSGGPVQLPACPGYGASTNLGKEFVTWDGSEIKLVADYDVYYNGNLTMRASPNGPPLPNGWTFLFPNGTRYRLEPDKTKWLEDKNGNRITFYSGWLTESIYGVNRITDPLGRTVTIAINQQDPQHGNVTKITYKGFNGQDRVIDVGAVNVWLPDGKSYNFAYNDNLELERVELPTGGAYEYTWGGDIPQQTQQQNCLPPNAFPFRYVTERRVKADGVNLSSKMTFSTPNGMTQVDTYDGFGNRLSRSKHYFHGNPVPPVPPSNPSWPDAAADEIDATKGKEYLTEFYAGGDGATLLRKEETEWVSPRHVTWTVPNFPSLDINIDARVASRQTTLADVSPNLIARTEYLYNQGEWANAPFNVLTDTLQYGYGQGVPGPFLSRSHSEYLSYTQPYILLLPKESWVSSDVNGNAKVAFTKYEYDDYSANPLQDCPDIVGHDAAYGAAYTARGNVTKVTRYTDAQSQTGEITTSAKYDIAGNVVKSFDARGNATEFDFSDRFGSPDAEAQSNTAPPELSPPSGAIHTYAFPTRVTNALGHAAHTQYDYYTGQAVNTEDANGTVTKLSYGLNNDRLDRLAQVEQAANYPPAQPELHGQTTYAYDDTNRKVTTTSDLSAYGDNKLKTTTFYDGLGRVVKTRRYETTTQYIETLTEYDLPGGASRASNPYRPTLGETPVWTTTEYDALGRVRQVTLPDNTTAVTEYAGVYTTVTDQAGKKRRQKVDALGRTVRVDEPDGGGNLDLGNVNSPLQPSFYEYDALGNVVRISQGLAQQGASPENADSYVQHRYFKYDSLSRLTYERQAEQAGTTTTAADPLTGNTAWSRRLTYDETLEGVSYKGLLTTAEDARHVVTHLYYDQLGRSTRVTYSDGTPTVTSSYDQARTNYFNVGRLTEVTTAPTTAAPQTSQLYDYDRVGRTVRQQQVVDTNTYSLSYSYNPGGALTSETYPSGRVVSYAYDAAARLQSVSSGATVYAGGMTYKPFGGLESVALGNGTTLTMGYSPTRLQLSSITLAQGATTLQRYDYRYGQVNMTTGAVDETKNNGQLGSVESVIGTQRQWQQRLQYDSLGRLSSAGEYYGDNLQNRTYLLNYDYDAYGNRFQKQSSNLNNQVAQSWVEGNAYDALTNRLTSGLTYDDAGNVTRDERFRMLKLQYDANNRQKQSSSLTDTNVVQSVYDGLGQRVALKAAGALTSVMVYDLSGALVAEYGGSVSTNGTQYVMADQQGSTRVTMYGAPVGGQLVAARQDYLPFGEEVPGTAGPRAG